MSFPISPPAATDYWFDLSLPRRRRLFLPPNPPDWVQVVDLPFTPGTLARPNGLVVADRAPRPFAACLLERHEDGSVARIQLHLPAGGLFERDFPAWVDVYYGGGEKPADPVLAWTPPQGTLRAPHYEAELDGTGAIRRLTYLQLAHSLVEGSAGGGIAPVLLRSAKPEVVAIPPTHLALESAGQEPHAVTLSIVQDSEDLTLHRQVRFTASFIEVRFRAEIRRDLDLFAPLGVQHRMESGYVIGPNGERRAVCATETRDLDLPVAKEYPGYVFSSETGCFVFGGGEGRVPDRLVYCASGANPGLALLGYAKPQVGQVIEGSIVLLPAPFAGDSAFDRAAELRRQLLNPAAGKVQVEPEEELAASFRPVGESQTGERHGLAARNLRFLVETRLPDRATARFSLETRDERTLLTADTPYVLEAEDGARAESGPSLVRLESGTLFLEGDMTGPRGGDWRIRSRITPRLLNGRVLFEEERRHLFLGPEPLEARFRFDARTPAGPPAWNYGDATVFLPGQMARGNYCPGQRHGGGPKWGPSPSPEPCPFCKEQHTPGHADHWTLAASRLPNTWAVAADRERGILAFLGADPRSDAGETSVGFHSPAAGTTTLRLATPITYEPWLPHGYGGFDREPRRDTRPIVPGEEFTWRLVYSGEATKSLNDWYDLDQAMYGLAARFRPAAYKMPYETALRLTLDSLHRNFYRPKDRVISYSTGPDGQRPPIGFTGMSHPALCLLEGGTRLNVEEWRDAGLAVLDNIATAFLNGPKFPFVAWSEETGWTVGSGEPGYLILCALDNLLEAIELERGRGETHPAWEKAARRCCDAWIDVQSLAGAFPLKHPDMGAEVFPTPDYDATNVTVGVIACLVDAARLLEEPHYLDSAVRAADFYGRLLDEGKLWGGPGDIEALVNSEVPMFYLRSFVRLALRTGDTRHKAWARDAGAWRLAFQFAHTWPLDFGSQLFRQGWAGLGSETASASNLHSVCFGCINVPDYRLAHELFGDTHWIERLRDLADYATQQYGRFDGDVDILDAGQGTESWWTSDTKWGKGNVLLLLDKPNLGFMAWTTAWSAYGLLHALTIREQEGWV